MKTLQKQTDELLIDGLFSVYYIGTHSDNLEQVTMFKLAVYSLNPKTLKTIHSGVTVLMSGDRYNPNAFMHITVVSNHFGNRFPELDVLQRWENSNRAHGCVYIKGEVCAP